MKKLVKMTLACALSLTALTACAGGGGEDTPTAEGVVVGFVTDTGGINDKSFNQSSYEGVQRYYAEANLGDAKYIESKAENEYIPNLSNFAENGTDLIVAAGFKFETAIQQVADLYPEQKMLVIDVGGIDNAKYPNIQQAVFAEHEGSFLAGVAAAMKAKELGEDTVGFIIGMENATMLKFFAGYQQGVWAVDENMKVLYDNANSFDNQEKGKTLAAKQFEKTSVIFHAAGGVGNGVINKAKELTLAGTPKWVIGVDKDQYEEGFVDEKKEQSVILTSMIKRVDVAAYNASKAVAEGTFKGELVTYALKDNGVGLPENNPNLSEEVLNAVKEFTDKIVAGELEVSPEAISSDKNPNTTFVPSAQ